ncbi:sensor histidine kinase [Microbulbifer echini]|uniref:Sensor histidine kinase n=1 Tax=Microbulbifer echini TaxID=1529067 RepID=A0ABV4NRH1_9GAMM
MIAIAHHYFMSILKDLKHPFFAKSFVVVLLLDIACVFVFFESGDISSISSALTGAPIWFVFFYWLPTWSTALIVLRLRRRGYHSLLIEWMILVVHMTIGNQCVSWFIEYAFNVEGGLNMGLGIIFNGLMWATCLYCSYAMLEYRHKASEQKLAMQKAKLQTLRYQLNPHFMFNSLNTISSYIHSDPHLADEVLHKLADILRYSLDTGELEETTIKEEIELINKYLEIEKIRFGDHLKVEITVDPRASNISIPPLLLQPIFENCFKHCRIIESLHIQCRIYLKNDKVIIEVVDNGYGFQESVLSFIHSQGTGIHNLRQRIELQPNGKLTLSNQSGAHVKVEMSV